MGVMRRVWSGRRRDEYDALDGWNGMILFFKALGRDSVGVAFGS